MSMTEHDEESLNSICRELLEEHGNVAEAATALMARMQKDDDLYKRVINGAARSICYTRINRIARLDRERAMPQVTRVSELTAGDIAQWSQAVATGIMDTFRLPGGKLLGDAQRPEVEAAAMTYRTLKEDASIKERFLLLVAGALKEGQRVRDQFTEDKIKALRAEARSTPVAA